MKFPAGVQEKSRSSPPSLCADYAFEVTFVTCQFQFVRLFIWQLKRTWEIEIHTAQIDLETDLSCCYLQYTLHCKFSCSFFKLFPKYSVLINSEDSIIKILSISIRTFWKLFVTLIVSLCRLHGHSGLQAEADPRPDLDPHPALQHFHAHVAGGRLRGWGAAYPQAEVSWW